MDPEQQRPVAEKQFLDAPVETLSWSGLTVTVKERKTGQPKTLVGNVEGIVQAGWSLTCLSQLTGLTEPLANAFYHLQANAALSWAHPVVARPRF